VDTGILLDTAVVRPLAAAGAEHGRGSLRDERLAAVSARSTHARRIELARPIDSRFCLAKDGESGVSRAIRALRVSRADVLKLFQKHSVE
jgi:hypothetical protein